MTTFTKENEGKTFIIGQRLSWRQIKARAVDDSDREVELKFIKITDKSVVYEVTIYGITHKVKSMIQIDELYGPAAIPNRYIKFTKKAVWGIFHGTIAHEEDFIEKKEEEEEEDDVCCVGCGEFVCKYEDEPDHKDERDEAICDDCYEEEEFDYWVVKNRCLKLITSTNSKIEEMGWDEWGEMVGDVCDERKKKEEEEDTDEEAFPEDEHFCGTCSIPLVEDDFFTLTEEFGGRCESCREDEEKIGIHISILEENCGNCGK